MKEIKEKLSSDITYFSEETSRLQDHLEEEDDEAEIKYLEEELAYAHGRLEEAKAMLEFVTQDENALEDALEFVEWASETMNPEWNERAISVAHRIRLLTKN